MKNPNVYQKVIGAGIILLALHFLALSAHAQQGSAPEVHVAARILELTNQARQQNGLPPLASVGHLVTAASRHSQEMLNLDYFAHLSPTQGYRTPRERIMAAGGVPTHTAENIYRCQSVSPGQVADRTVQAWLDSPGHRKTS